MSKIFYDVPNSQTNGQDADETYLFLGTKVLILNFVSTSK